MARMAIDDSVHRDPRIRRVGRALYAKFGDDMNNWPDFVLRYTLGMMLGVWALPYDRVNPVVAPEDVDETAMIDDFTALLVQSGLAEYTADGVLIRGARKRIGYLIRSEDNGREGGVKSGKARRGELPPSQPQLALPPGEDDKPKKPRKSKKEKSPPTPGHQATVDHFHRRYVDRFGKGPTWNGKTGALIARLIKAHGDEEVRRRIDVLFDSPPAFLASSAPDVGTLSQHFDKLVTGPRAPTTNGKSGRFEPRDGMDYEKPPWEK